MIRKLIYLLGASYRNNLTWKSYRFLSESQRWPINRIHSYQCERCYELLEWAYQNSSFYKTKFDDDEVTPRDFRTLNDLAKFPLVTKEEIINCSSDIQISHGFKKLFFAETSGSTGQPLTFYRDAEWDAWTRAAMFRGYSWYNVKPWDKNGYFWGYNIDPKAAKKIRLLDFLQNRFRIFSYKEDDVRKFASKLTRADYLEGYSSMIYEVAKIINEKGIKNRIDLKMVKGTSEKIYDKYQEAAIKAFGKKIISEYGAAEAGLIAFECPYGKLHVAMENVIVEVIDEEIVVTNLLSKSFPVIRYKLGDHIELDRNTKCKCGMEHYTIKDVIGRVGKVIYGFRHKFPSLTLYYVFKNLAINNGIVLNYQGVQHHKGVLDINLEQTLTRQQSDKLDAELHKYFREDLKIRVNEKQVLEREGGKMKDLISTL